MHTALARINALMSVLLVTLGGCAGTMALVSFVQEGYLRPSLPRDVSLEVRTSPVRTIGLGHPLAPQDVRNVDRTVVFLNFNADFNPVFNWNTKVIYVYAVAHYETPEMQRNEVTLWDTILTAGGPEANIGVEGAAKYYLEDYATGLSSGAGARVTVQLWYHIMSHSGITFTRKVEGASVSFTTASG